MNFTYEAYRNLLRLLMDKYTICSYHTYQNQKDVCILRHDIDMSIEKALCFAELEYSLGIKTTYFVLINTGFYNCSFCNTIDLIHKIQQFGHEIGLHFDELQYNDCDDEERLEYHVYEEARILENAIGEKISTVSMHRPSKKTLESDYAFEGIINSYSKVFFDEFKYISDSRMHWRENVENIVKNKQYNMLHILTHPIWYTETGNTTHDILSNFIRSASSERYSLLSENIRNIEEFIRSDEY